MNSSFSFADSLFSFTFICLSGLSFVQFADAHQAPVSAHAGCLIPYLPSVKSPIMHQTIGRITLLSLLLSLSSPRYLSFILTAKYLETRIHMPKHDCDDEQVLICMLSHHLLFDIKAVFAGILTDVLSLVTIHDENRRCDCHFGWICSLMSH